MKILPFNLDATFTTRLADLTLGDILLTVVACIGFLYLCQIIICIFIASAANKGRF